MGIWGVFQQKEQKMPGAHKSGAAIFGPRLAGGKNTDMRLFLNKFQQKVLKKTGPTLSRIHSVAGSFGVDSTLLGKHGIHRSKTMACIENV